MRALLEQFTAARKAFLQVIEQLYSGDINSVQQLQESFSIYKHVITSVLLQLSSCVAAVEIQVTA